MKKAYKLFLWAAVFFIGISSRAQEANVMNAHYINVGQGAAVLLEFPCGAILIDAGAQDDNYKKNLVDYLTNFFKRRTDLHSTLALVMITHPHVDHNEALKDVAQKFRIERYIDDGLRVGSGRFNQIWMQDHVAAAGIRYESFSFEDITKRGNKNGKTDTIIDPVNCSNGDPKIILYSARFASKPDGWSQDDFKNYNNHSLVVKVLFGKASFLFTGDLETKGIEAIIDKYAASKALDVDILMVGHHCAANASTFDYLSAVSPTHAIISCGEWDFGKGDSNPFTTFAYGHPRISALNMLKVNVVGKRSQSVRIKAAEGSKDFRFYDVVKRIYATAWDGTIVVRANMDGTYKVRTEPLTD